MKWFDNANLQSVYATKLSSTSSSQWVIITCCSIALSNLFRITVSVGLVFIWVKIETLDNQTKQIHEPIINIIEYINWYNWADMTPSSTIYAKCNDYKKVPATASGSPDDTIAVQLHCPHCGGSGVWTTVNYWKGTRLLFDKTTTNCCPYIKGSSWLFNH